MISNFVIVTRTILIAALPICLGIYYYSFTVLEVNILTNILLLMYKSIFNINGPILFGLCFRLPIRQRLIQVALNRESYRSDPTETYLLNRNRFDRGHKLHRTKFWPRSRAWCPATECLHPNVRVWIRKITQKHFKNIMMKEHS